jgi:hypothetical protein
MKWHSYTEEYALRQISGEKDRWLPYLEHPDFSVDNSGTARVKDATLITEEGRTVWLLSCAPSKTWVAYQSQFDKDLPVDLDCPAGRFYTERMPFGKVVVHQETDNKVSIDIDAGYRSPEETGPEAGSQAFMLYVEGTDHKPEITINGISYQAKKETKDGRTVWKINPYDQQGKLEQTMKSNELITY